MHPSTFSIVAHDPDAQEWGVAVASKFLAVGSVVPWARAGAGAVATQALANITYGPKGIDLLSGGKSAQEVLSELVESDEMSEHRQAGVVDAQGRAATFTGEQCMDWAGGVVGKNCTCQGNILTGPNVVEEMKHTFESEAGSLADRLLASLLAGDRAGGDRRGKQSSAILVAREGGGYMGASDVALDLRVDDHVDPVPELKRLRGIHRLYLEAPKPEDAVEIDATLSARLADLLVGAGAIQDPGEYSKESLKSYISIQNLEMRWLEGDRVDRHVLSYLEDKAKEG